MIKTLTIRNKQTGKARTIRATFAALGRVAKLSAKKFDVTAN